MSRKLEAALAAEKKAAARRERIERHERLVAVSVEQLRHVRAKDYRAAEEDNIEANEIMQAMRADADAAGQEPA